ncbi:hypothetical protein [Paenibacillus sp. GYB003]|uniref:hypothetical protein n=1 Tax=Paenibacillus sp. GYB003 TaxID=2994392 RepID=UPI002F96A3C9
MRFVTETRLKLLEDVVRTISDPDERSYALHLLDSIRSDIEANYAEIVRPVRLESAGRTSGGEPYTALTKR